MGRTGTDASVVDELPEGLRDHGIEQAFAGEGDEETRILRPRLELIAQLGVVGARETASPAIVRWWIVERNDSLVHLWYDRATSGAGSGHRPR